MSNPSSSAESIKLNVGDYLLYEGEESTEMYYLQQGTLAVFKRKGEKEQQIGTIISGELVGEMSFLDKHPRSASVKAMTECTLVVVPHEKLEATLNGLPKWFTALLLTLLDRLRKANARIKI
ncbi:MAG: cyclic nucleotide-binding domain-containing protein [Rhizobacter sp.]|nr:cyclic nucleotide-binding domain-containing protein [Bacteriovorax sp.]